MFDSFQSWLFASLAHRGRAAPGSFLASAVPSLCPPGFRWRPLAPLQALTQPVAHTMLPSGVPWYRWSVSL